MFSVLLVLLLAVAPVAVAVQTTADQVKDRESLKAFVLDAKQYLENLRDYNDVIATRETLREQPRWAFGDTYLLFLMLDGSISLHAGDRSFQGRDILDIRVDRGVATAREMMKVGEAGGGFVDYVDGVPKTAYSIRTKTGVGNIEFYLVGGYSKDLSSTPLAGKDVPPPPVTAAEVVDKEFLVAFVEAAADAYRGAYGTEKHEGLMAVRNAFRKEGGPWRAGNFYLWVVGSRGYIIFHGFETWREGKPFNLDRVDVNLNFSYQVL
ncbi:MAG: cache domain-containing protein [Rhodobacteraceae bacterium]|nr:cache domain-containing protein [Paracoccaceae bacterium]